MNRQGRNLDRTDGGNQPKGGGSSVDGGPDNQSKGGGSSVDGGPDNQSDNRGSSSDGDGPDSQEIKELKEGLQKLKKRVSKECFECAQRLTECFINKTPTDLKELLQFLTLLEKELPQKESWMSNRVFPLNWFCPAVPRVKVFCVVTGQTWGADQVIRTQLTKSEAVETKDLQECDVIIVFCSVKSRVGSDVDAAMRKDPVSSGNKPVILVLLYHTRDHYFSPDVTKWSETYRNIKMVSHILFHQTQQGLLPNCPRNERAIQEIQKELKRFS